MHVLLIGLAALALAFPLSAKSVKGYAKKDGTYVQPHQRTNANSTKSDNHSTKGNTNPYTGKKGSKAADK